MGFCSRSGLRFSLRSESSVWIVWLTLGSAPAGAIPSEQAPDPGLRTAAEYVEELVRAADSERLWDETIWLRLGHYRAATFGGYQSEVDGDAFFLARRGESDPRAELHATLRAVFRTEHEAAPGVDPDSPLAAHPFCRYPARVLWLDQRLTFDWDRLPRQPCPRFAEFLDRMRPESVTLVFSSYFLNNPASAFGHTFLRINKRGERGGDGQDLLDYGIDFSATVDTNNALVYAFKGLTGMFPGVFRRIPYYYKVREYNDYETRDLWEYELSLSEQQSVMITAHLWELGHTYFDYFYLSENCSYHVLGVLEVADPDIDLLAHVNWPSLPVDTLRALYENPGLVRHVRYRPSARTQFTARVKSLNPSEVELVAQLMADPQAPLPDAMAREDQARILDVALDLVGSKYSRERVKDGAARDEDVATLEQALLLRRAQLLVQSDAFQVAPPFRLEPHSSHDARRLSLGSGWDRARGAFHRLDFRLALHDLADPPRGYPESAQIEFLPTRLHYLVENPSLWLEELTLARVMSLAPWTRFERPLSWTLRAGFTRIRDAGCDGCLATQAEVGGGFTFSAVDERAMIYMLGIAETSALAPIRGGVLDLPLRLAAGPQAGLRLRFTDDLVSVFHARFSFLPTQVPATTWQTLAQLRYQYIDDFVLGLEGEFETEQTSVSALSMIYF